MTMNATERARRSDSLHYDNVSRRKLCDMVARLEDNNERLSKLAQDMLYVIKTFEDAYDESVVRCRVIMDVDYFDRRLNELGIKERTHE